MACPTSTFKNERNGSLETKVSISRMGQEERRDDEDEGPGVILLLMSIVGQTD